MSEHWLVRKDTAPRINDAGYRKNRWIVWRPGSSLGDYRYATRREARAQADKFNELDLGLEIEK